MNLFKKIVYVIMAVFLLVPATVFAQDYPEIDGEIEMSESLKSRPSPKLQESDNVRSSKQNTRTAQSTSIAQSLNPRDYPLVKNGDWIDILLDSWYTEHYFMLDGVKEKSSKDLNVRILYASDDPYLKDSIIDLEFYKENKGKLSISGYTQFDTIGYDALALNSSIPKDTFKDQQYIYIRIGVSEHIFDDYYSDVTTFKVKNPFYSSDKTPPAVPSVSSISDRDKKVTGKAEAASKVTVKVGSKVLNSATADKAGKFTIPLKSVQKAGTVLHITATDKAGNVSKAKKVTVIDKTPPSAPKVNKVTTRSTAVTGKAEANATVSVKVGKKIINSSKAGKNGSFSVKIKKQKVGTVLQVSVKDKVGNTSKTTKTTVKKK